MADKARRGLLAATVLGTCLGEPGLPNYHGCVYAVAQQFPYCNTSLPIERRLDDLLSRMSLEEKVAQITPDTQTGVGACHGVTKGSYKLGLSEWLWLTETNTNIASRCPVEGRCATTFVGPMGLGAAFNRSLWRLKGSVFGTEMRAFNNIGATRAGDAPLIGLSAFGPNINIARDPRFGRNSELPGEDPLLSGTYAAEMVAGMQERDAQGYPKVAAFLKHFTAYSTEANRGHDTYNISQQDFFDTYLRQYELAFKSQPYGVMCSYDAENGRPSCANDWLLNKVLRSWRADALVATDCGVVSNLRGAPVGAPDDEHAAAWTLMNGTDVELGTTLFGSLPSAVSHGLATETRVDEAVRRSFRSHFELGRFDPPEACEWTKLGLEDVNSSLHQQISYEAALQSLVLLKNDGGALPLKAGSKIAVLGPQGVTRKGLLSDYASDDICFNGGEQCIVSVADAIQQANAGGATLVHKAVNMSDRVADGVKPALDDAATADAVVLVLGIDKTVEHEGIDRTDTALPGMQEALALQALALGKPTVLVLTNGGALAIDRLADRNSTAPYAIVEAFNPAVVGGKAVAASLFGLENRWGKLPVTMYPRSFIQEKAMTDYCMSSSPGRTYRYYTGTPLFAFGSGLSLTTFAMGCAADASSDLLYRCNVTNTGARWGDEVVLLYHSALDIGKVDHPVPRRTLVDFARVSLGAGERRSVAFQLSRGDFELVNAKGERTLYGGKHLLTFSRGNGADVTVQVDIKPSQISSWLQSAVLV